MIHCDAVSPPPFFLARPPEEGTGIHAMASERKRARTRIMVRFRPGRRVAALALVGAAMIVLHAVASASLQIGLEPADVTESGGGRAHASEMERHPRPARSQLTIRVNTFRRNDLLKPFVEHFAQCDVVREIQVVWSDQENEPPGLGMFDLPKRHGGHRKGGGARGPSVVFERHTTDSLNNRFLPTIAVPTEVRDRSRSRSPRVSIGEIEEHGECRARRRRTGPWAHGLHNQLPPEGRA